MGARIMRKVRRVTISMAKERVMRKEAVRQSVQKAGREVVVFGIVVQMCWLGKDLQLEPVQRRCRPWFIRGV